MRVTTPTQAPTPTPPSEPPYPWRVGLALVLAALLLGGVFYGATQLVKTSATSGQGGVGPTETAIAQAVGTAAAAPTRTPAPQATTTPQAAPTPVPTTPPVATQAPAAQPTAAAPTGASTALSAPAAVPAATPHVTTIAPAPALVQPATRTTPDPATSAPIPTAAQSATATPVSTVDPELAAEVSAAYARYWQVLADADWSNDPSALDQVAAGEQLVTLRNNIAEDQSLGRATRVRVQLNYVVVSAHGDQAQVNDHIQDLSVYVDPSTHERLPGEVEPSSADTAPTTDAAFQLQLLDGTWKVIRAAQGGGGS